MHLHRGELRVVAEPETPQRYIVGDPSFVSFSGHCFEYIQSLVEPLRASGHEVVIAGNRGMNGDVANRTGARGVFTYWCDARPVPPGIDERSAQGRTIVRMVHEKKIRSDLDEFDGHIRFRKSDVFIINTLRHWPLRGLVDWIESLPDERAPNIVLILHFTAWPVPGQKVNDSQMYQDGFKRIEDSRYRDRFVMLADSEGLVNEYRAISSLDFRVAPIPHTKTLDASVIDARTGRAVRLTYAGEARTNKGFHLLPYVVEALDRRPALRPHRFEIQSFIHNRDEPFYKIAMGKMRRSQSCTFIDAQLDDAGYDAFIRRADVILVPYLLDNYYIQTSGIYSEAVSLAKPVIVPMGSWMATQVRRYGGGVTFPPNDHQGLLDATRQVLDHYDDFCAQAVAASKAWHAFHTPARLLGMIDRMQGEAA